METTSFIGKSRHSIRYESSFSRELRTGTCYPDKALERDERPLRWQIARWWMTCSWPLLIHSLQKRVESWFRHTSSTDSCSIPSSTSSSSPSSSSSFNPFCQDALNNDLIPCIQVRHCILQVPPCQFWNPSWSHPGMPFSFPEQRHLVSIEEGIEWSSPLLIVNEQQIGDGTLFTAFAL